MTGRGKLVVEGATEIEVPRLGRIAVRPTFAFDGDTTTKPFNAAYFLAIECARVIAVRAGGRDQLMPETARKEGRRDH